MITTVLVPTAFGVFGASLSELGVCNLRFPNDRRAAPGGTAAAADPRAGLLGAELDAYLRGELAAFTFPVDLRGTAFQRGVWEQLRAIPYGEVRSYGDLARALGRASAVRAVGAANGANPVPVIVPCHRVIGSDGRLVGFGGGLDWKRRLLAVENPERWAGSAANLLDWRSVST
jgi:methylated-DNA-[protein]-cysteine S-methyltransferase